MSVASEVVKKLGGRPFLLKALQDGYANQSVIARQIQGELKKEGVKASFESVRAALKRFADEKLHDEKIEDGISRLLKNSRLSLTNKITAMVIEPTRENARLLTAAACIAVVKSKNGLMAVAEDEKVAQIKKIIRPADILIETRGLVALNLTTPESIEDVPGVVAFVTNRLAEEGINIKEFFSSYTDTTMLLEEKDAQKAFKIMEGLV